MLKHIFLHNEHDKLSRDKLAECFQVGLCFEVIKPYDGPPGLQGISVRALPAYVIVSDVSGVAASFESESLDPAVIASLTFEETPPEPVIPMPTAEERIAALEMALLELMLREV